MTISKNEIGIPRTVLADRLKRLVASGLMIQQDYKADGSRPRKEYCLTEMGEALSLPFIAMREWSDRWVGKGRMPPMRPVRRSDGSEIRVALVDDKGRVVPPDDLAVRFEDWAANPPAES
ncbi:winged helix-turn-helix transcriptional regulator [Novosphingobium colocasiae]